jgi:cobalt-zinc-cadmium efflux system protein
MSTTETALTAHLVMPSGCEDGFVPNLAHELIHEFSIAHSTIQIDRDFGGCSLAV